MYRIELTNDNDICHSYYDGQQVEKGWPGEPVVQTLTPMSTPLRDMLTSLLTKLAASPSPSPLYFAAKT